MTERNKPRILDYLLVIYTIYITDSILFATNSNHAFIAFKRYFTVLMAVFFLYDKQRRQDNRENRVILFITISLLLSMLLIGELLGFLYFTQIAIFVFSICYCLRTNREIYMNCYVNVLRIISFGSLIVFFFSDFFSALPFIPTVRNLVDINFKFFGITSLPLVSSLQGRNWGPFWEPGAYQLYLNVAFLFTLFRKSQNRYKLLDALLFAFTCITTKSGASFVGLAFILIGFLLYSNRGERRSIKMVLILTVGLMIVFFLSTDEFYRTFEKVFLGLDSEDNISFAYRFSSAMTYIQGFLHSPLWGNSATYLEDQMKKNTFELVKVYGSGNTNTILSYFAYYGGIIGCFIVFHLYKSMKSFSDSNNNLVGFMLLCGIIAATSNENFMCSSTLCVIVFSHMMSKDNFGGGKDVEYINESF